MYTGSSLARPGFDEGQWTQLTIRHVANPFSQQPICRVLHNTSFNKAQGIPAGTIRQNRPTRLHQTIGKAISRADGG